MFCHLYILNGIAYIPTAAKTEAGYYMDIEPVEVISSSDKVAFAQSIKRTIIRGNPTVPTPTRATGFPKPVVLKYANLKSMAAFEKKASSWHLDEKNGLFIIEQWQNRPQGGWVPDPARTESLPMGTPIDEAVRRLVDKIQNSIGTTRGI